MPVVNFAKFGSHIQVFFNNVLYSWYLSMGLYYKYRCRSIYGNLSRNW